MKSVCRSSLFLLGALACPTLVWGQAIELSSPDARQIVSGVSAGARMGSRLDRGDVSGDVNNRDLIVSAPNFSSNTGRVYVFFGWIHSAGDFPASNADVTLTGAATGDLFGASAKTGLILTSEPPYPIEPTTSRDLVVGAPGANGGKGAVYVFAGPLSGGSLTPANAIFTIIGATGDNLGLHVETTDLNGDRFREVIIAANNKVYVVDVKNASGSTLDLGSQTPLTTLTGFGSISAMAGRGGEVTGDGMEDLAVGDANASSGAGVVYLLKGKAPGQAWPTTVNVTVGADAKFTGERAGDHAGSAMWSSDVDGDRIADIVIGAPDYDGRFNSRPNAGGAYILWGGPGILTSRSLSAADVRIFGATPGDRTGAHLALGDVTRDEPDDIALLAPGANGGLGRIQLLYGRSKSAFAALGNVLDLESQGDGAINAEAGNPIEAVSVFDVTGEGAEDIVAGVPTATTSAGANAGKLYFAISPSLTLETNVVSEHLTASEGLSGNFKVFNLGYGTVTYSVTSGASWLQVSPANGSSSMASPGVVNYSVAKGLAPGTYTTQITVRSTTNSLLQAKQADFTLVITSCSAATTAYDYDCDGKADYAFFRPSTGIWQFTESSTNHTTSTSRGWGTTGDTPLRGDYDGDGRDDMVAYRPSTGVWYIKFSSTDFQTDRAIGWGGGDYVPVPGDYDGDKKTDVAVWRPATGMWWILTSSSNYANYYTVGWGDQNFIPVQGDYDGDGKTDVAAWKPSTGIWWILKSSTNNAEYFTKGWGDPNFVAVPADYDGDKKTDIAVWRPSTGYWWILTSSSNYANYTSAGWGDSTFKAIPADYDGDGKTDIAVWRPSTATWWVLLSTTNNASYVSKVWGTSTDVPIAKR
jgi:VCBS repeat protein/FG-GAP repeat protein